MLVGQEEEGDDPPTAAWRGPTFAACKGLLLSPLVTGFRQRGEVHNTTSGRRGLRGCECR